MGTTPRLRTLLPLLFVVLVAPLTFAQQTGSISGEVTATDGSALPGVTVEARSNVLPQPRTTFTDETGQYRLPALPPGAYTVTFNLAGMQTVTRRAAVQLSQNTALDAELGVGGVEETITVVAEASLVDRTSTEIETGITETEIEALPVTQNYGDLQKLIPGVMYTQDEVRGPSAGASGQENVYQFDGANVTMPLFGVLNVQPNTRDIAQVTVVKGGATATEFNRAGGFLIDTVSKSGTNEFAGELGFQVLNSDFIADQADEAQSLTYAEDRSWANVNLGGPLWRDRLYFYGSYYRPEFTRSNQSNLYGELPEYSRQRDEFFGKLTYTPTASWLINGTYRDSHDVETSGEFLSFQAPTTGTGFETELELATFEASWVINPRAYATLKFNDFNNPGAGVADFSSSAQVSTAPGTQLDLANLAEQGRLLLPTPSGSNQAYNEFIAPYIDRYGYVCPDNALELGLTCTPGQRTGGGTVGFGQYGRDDDSFYRQTAQVTFNYTLGLGGMTHDLHFGYQNTLDEEDRFQTANGWGVIEIGAGVGALGTCPAAACGTEQPAFFRTTFSQQTTGQVPVIHSEVRSQIFEINDAIRWNDWTFNVGLLAANDVLYGQGLAKADNVAGFVRSPGTKYKMHEFGWDEMLQPRLGATWAYNGTDTVWTSYARYYPPANSDARAASWDRSLVAQIFGYFDAEGKLMGVTPNAGSFGKWWQEGIKHPKIDEFMIGTARQLTPGWSGRLYGRYREGTDYIEDTNNNARVHPSYNAPDDIPNELYVPNLSEIVAAIGSGSSYVIANLDGAFTRYLEATLEQEWRGGNLVMNGSYTWSHYYGNFDQDNTTFNSANDTSTFIGSSNIGDAPGRQLWDFKYGDLRGDRRHVTKVRGVYSLPWNATAGAFAVWQSGQPYQLESVLPYRAFTGSPSETNRYAEPAGRRRSPSQYNVDFNYTQNIGLPRGLNLQLALDVFNLTNNQVGYNYETRIGILGFTRVAEATGDTVEIPDSISDSVLKNLLAPGAATFDRNEWAINAPYAKTFYAPRRFQIAARIQF